ncbi:MAG: ABC transporter permease [Coprococcus sp.]
MRRFLKLYRIEQKLFFRSADVFVFNLCMPVAVLLMISLIAGGKMAGDSGMTYLQSAFASLVAVGICCSAFMSIPIVVVDYRDKKILKHFYCSPCSPAWILGADVICSAVMAGISAIFVTLVAVLIFGYRMPGNAAAFVGAWFLTMMAMFSIGIMIASLCRTVKAMNVVTSAVYFPMLFLSGATIPYELFPAGLQKAAGIMPLTQGIQLMKAVSMGSLPAHAAGIVILLVAITAVCGTIAIKTFRWE